MSTSPSPMTGPAGPAAAIASVGLDIPKHEGPTLGQLRELVARADAAGLADTAELRITTRLSGKPAKLEVRGPARGWPVANEPLTAARARLTGELPG